MPPRFGGRFNAEALLSWVGRDRLAYEAVVGRIGDVATKLPADLIDGTGYERLAEIIFTPWWSWLTH